MLRFLTMVAGSPLYLYPWTFQLLLLQKRDLKHAAMLYGILCSAIMIGRFCGKDIPFSNKSSHNRGSPMTRIQCFILFVSFLLLSISTSFGIMLGGYFFIGLASSSLGSTVMNYKVYWRWRYPRGAGSNMRQDATRAHIVGLMFCTLLSGFTFNSQPDAVLPAYTSCIIIAVYFLVLNIFDFLNGAACFSRIRKSKKAMDSIEGSKFTSTSSSVIQPIADIEEVDPETEPTSAYIDAFEGDRDAARAAYIKRLEWRRKFDVDNIMLRPQDNFDAILRCYPHAIHGRSREGCAVVYEVSIIVWVVTQSIFFCSVIKAAKDS